MMSMPEFAVLDELDRDIVLALQVNGRASWKQVARAVGSTESTVTRRGQQLLANRVVAVTGVLDHLRCGLGISIYVLFRARPGRFMEVAQAVASLSTPRFVTVTIGSVDVVAEVVVESAPATRVPQAGASAVPVAVVAPVVAAPMVENIEPKPAEKQVEKPVEKMVERPQVAGVTLVDGVVLTQVPMALSTGGASVRLESISGDGAGVQWRVGDGPWTTPSAGQTADGRVEVRAGLDAQAVLVVDGTAQLRVSRLGRATIERCAEPRAASSVSVQVLRGAVEIRPLGEAAATGQMFARVRTPDQGFGLTGPLRVEYDAFTGTRRRVVNP